MECRPVHVVRWSPVTALLDLDANSALEHALALVDEAADMLAQIPMEAVVGLGVGEQLV